MNEEKKVDITSLRLSTEMREIFLHIIDYLLANNYILANNINDQSYCISKGNLKLI